MPVQATNGTHNGLGGELEELGAEDGCREEAQEEEDRNHRVLQLFAARETIGCQAP